MDTKGRVSPRRLTLRLAFATFAIVGLVALNILARALPASAASLALSGTVVCNDGNHVITWTITNTEPSITITITSAITAKDPLSYDVTGYAPILAPGATTQGTTIIPGSSTGGVVLYVYETWTDGSRSEQTSLDLGDPCPAATTTTTAKTTTSTALAPTTTAAVGTTVAAAGSTVAPTTTVAAALPRTGSSSKPLAGLALGALTIGLATIGLTRRTRQRA